MTIPDQIAALEDARFAAMLAGDIATLDRLMHPDLRYIHSAGEVDDKAAYLGSLSGGDMAYHSIQRSAVQISSTDTTAVVYARLAMEVTFMGAPRSVRSGSLAVWSQGPQGWQLLAVQSARLPEGA